jgi:hypothetical protein
MAGEIKSPRMKGLNESLFDFKVRDLGGVTMNDLDKKLDLLGAAQSSKAYYCTDANAAPRAPNAGIALMVCAIDQGGYRS